MLLAVFSFFYPQAGRSAMLTRNAIFFGVAWYMLVILVFDKDTVKFLMFAICGVAVIHFSYMLLQYFGFDAYKIFSFGLMKTTKIGLPTGLMTQTNESSGLIALTASAFLFNRYLAWCGIALTVIIFSIATSAGGMIAFYAGSVFYVCFSNKIKTEYKVAYVVYSVLFLLEFVRHRVEVGFEIPKLKSFLARYEDIWLESWEAYKAHWILGYGVGHWKIITKQLHAHNDFYQVLFEMGIASGVLMCGYLINVFRRLTTRAIIPATALVMILVHSCYSWLWCLGATAIIQVTWLAVLEIQLREGELKCQKM